MGRAWFLCCIFTHLSAKNTCHIFLREEILLDGLKRYFFGLKVCDILVSRNIFSLEKASRPVKVQVECIFANILPKYLLMFWFYGFRNDYCGVIVKIGIGVYLYIIWASKEIFFNHYWYYVFDTGIDWILFESWWVD